MMALGMVEVVGLPPAIEAADAALKAANVTLLAIAKADAGILTVELTGDVDAVSAAVEAGAKAAERIGTLRTKHVIPRADNMLNDTIIAHETQLFQSKRSQCLQQNEEPEITKESEIPEQPEVIPPATEPVPEVAPGSIPETVPEVTPEIPMIPPSTEPVKKPTPQEKPEREVEPISASNPIYKAAELKKKSNAYLHQLLEQNGVQVSSFGENMKKQDLISLIMKHQNKELKESEYGVTR